MTVIRPNSIAGVTSITAQNQEITFHTSDGTAIGQLNANINATNGVSTVTNLRVTGITTLGSSNGIGTVTIGIGTTALYVQGNARITGIMTVGSSSITLDGSSNQINVGTGITVHHTNGVQVGSNTLHSTGLTVNNINVGVITATSFIGNGSGLTGAGSTVADDTSTNSTFYPLFTTATTGTVTASKVSTTKLTFNPSTGTLAATTFSGSGASLTSIPNSATTATSANTTSAIVARDSSGNFTAGTITANLVGNISNTVTGTNSTELVRGNMADNDNFRILIGGTGSNSGYAEIATADDGSEPIHVRQYTGVFSSLSRTATLLDGSGNTSFPGSVSASGNVTAYASDKRLKENFNYIQTPLQKILKLNGYTFDWNSKSEELGFTPQHKKNDIGLIAQEVQEVLPQAVVPAPFDLECIDSEYISKSGENYLTVQYERLVPLLVEAIKEQQLHINKLNEKIDYLLSKCH